MRLQQEKEVSSTDSAADRRLRKCGQGKTVDGQCEKAWTELEVPRLPLCWKYESAANTLEMGKTGIIENSRRIKYEIITVKRMENSLPLCL